MGCLTVCAGGGTPRPHDNGRAGVRRGRCLAEQRSPRQHAGRTSLEPENAHVPCVAQLTLIVLVTLVVTPRGPGGSADLVSAGQDGGEGQNRTADTAVFSRVLCQLSYLAWNTLVPVQSRGPDRI